MPVLILGSEVLALAASAGSSKYRPVFEVNRKMLPWVMEQVG